LRELRKLHVEIARRAEGAQHRFGRLARLYEWPGELALEESQSGIDAARRDAQLVQLLRILSQPRAGLMPAPGSEQTPQLCDRHIVRGHREIEVGLDSTKCSGSRRRRLCCSGG